MSEVVHIRLGAPVKKEMVLVMKQEGTFANVTDFIRDCIRHRLKELKLEKALRSLEEMRGSVKNVRRLTRAERDKAFKEYLKKDPSEILRKYGLDKVPHV